MKNGSVITALLAVMLTAVGCTNHIPPAADDRGAGWITLFDGSEASLNNWNRVGDANWRIYRGAVLADARAGKTPGYLVTKNAYGDFQLRAEFWASHDANSGIYMRCADPKKITDRSCYEANIFDQRPDPLYGTGAIVHLAAVYPMPKAGGKWNTYEILAKGNRVSVWLNGNLTVELVDNKFARGPIALQYGSGVVMFRNVQVRPL